MNLGSRVELLAPGGSLEGIKAAVNAGADAVYAGGRRFGARAYAENPDDSGLFDAIDYCHLHGARLYMTVNTLLKENELERELYDFVLPVYEHGVDAVLVQDMGVFRFLRREFPLLPLHASTQMTITGEDGASLLKEMGAARAVLSRELSLDEIRRIHEAVDIELETFIHGALCYCYSGQCLMSSMIGSRSGNRGRCAQPCRLPYRLKENEGALPEKGTERGRDPRRYGSRGKAGGRTSADAASDRGNSSKGSAYLLSLKDICTLDLIPDLIDAGISSLKIEGRMKRPEYAAGVSSVYRHYIDLYLENGRKGYSVRPEDRRDLMDLYNRGGFSDGYYRRRNDPSMMASDQPNHCGTRAATVQKDQSLKAEEDLFRQDRLEYGGKEFTLDRDLDKGAVFRLKGLRKATPGQPVMRTRAQALLDGLRGSYMDREKEIPVEGRVLLKAGGKAELTVSTLDGVYRINCSGAVMQNALKSPLDEETVRRQLMKTGDSPFRFTSLKLDMDQDLFCPLKELNGLRRDALELLTEKIEESFRRAEPVRAEERQEPAAEKAFCMEKPDHAAEKAFCMEKPDHVAEKAFCMEKPDHAAEKVFCMEKSVHEAAEEEENLTRSGNGLLKEGPAVSLQADADRLPEKNGIRLTASVRTAEQLLLCLNSDLVSGIYADCALFVKGGSGNNIKEQAGFSASGIKALLKDGALDPERAAGACRSRKKSFFLMLPPIWRMDTADTFSRTFPPEKLQFFDGLLLRSFDQLKRGKEWGIKDLRSDCGLYSWNREARAMLRELGVTQDSIPYECTQRELMERGTKDSEMVIYGRIPLMITAQCLVKNSRGCRKQPAVTELTDRMGAVFPVLNECAFCYNMIYNSVPLDLIGMLPKILSLPLSCVRLNFTVEKGRETETVLHYAEQTMAGLKSEGESPLPAFTRGHFRKGVE